MVTPGNISPVRISGSQDVHDLCIHSTTNTLQAHPSAGECFSPPLGGEVLTYLTQNITWRPENRGAGGCPHLCFRDICVVKVGMCVTSGGNFWSGEVKPGAKWKPLQNSFGNLLVRQFMGIFHADDMSRQTYALHAFLELVFGPFRTKNLDLYGVMNVIDDAVVISIEVTPEAAVTYICRRAFSGDNRGILDVILHIRGDDPSVLHVVVDAYNNSLVTVNPQANSFFQLLTPFGIIIPIQLPR